MREKKIIYCLIIMTLIIPIRSSGNQDGPGNSDNSLQKTFNTSSLEWKLWGVTAYNWRYPDTKKKAEPMGLPVHTPSSVQMCLKNAGLIKDWNVGTNSRERQWIENNSWIYSVPIPDEWIGENKITRLVCNGLDDNGFVYINGKEAGQFNNAFIPWSYDITPYLKANNNTLDVIFNPPPRYIGSPYWTSKIKDWKPRFYYAWDWMPRNVQVGIWDDILIEVTDKDQVVLDELKVLTAADRYKDLGELKLSGVRSYAALKGTLGIQLKDVNGKLIIHETVPCTQTLYQLECKLYDEHGNLRQEINREVGFKNISWESNKNAPVEADPWLCVVNNKPVFLQGINWTPIRPNFADLREADYRKLITTYKELGVNIFRVWGGACIEKEWFYTICDEMGIMIWQEFPLSSSGFDNYPPETPGEIQTMAVIARSYVKRLRHHASLLMWCGGNELYEIGDKAIVTDKHSMMRCMKEIISLEDPDRRFVPGSPSGNNIWGGLDNFGKGINWDTHGPWSLPFTENDHTMAAVEKYWQLDDALMHSEVGVGGSQSEEMINKYRGNLNALPANRDNPLWNQCGDWVDWDDFLKEHNGTIPATLNQYVTWSQDRQTKGLTIALKACKMRFPACGGFIIRWVMIVTPALPIPLLLTLMAIQNPLLMN